MGADTLEEAVDIRMGVSRLLRNARMNLCKWRSNSKELLGMIPEKRKDKEVVHLISAPGQCQKGLSLHWDTGRDCLHVATPTIIPHTDPTKRQISSDTSRTFDLLWWFTPSVVVLKILLQKLWILGMA